MAQRDLRSSHAGRPSPAVIGTTHDRQLRGVGSGARATILTTFALFTWQFPTVRRRSVVRPNLWETNLDEPSQTSRDRKSCIAFSPRTAATWSVATRLTG